MAKMFRGLAAAAALLWAGSAQATIRLDFAGNLTLTRYEPGPPDAPDPVGETGFYHFYMKAADWDADRFYLYGTPFAGDLCEQVQLGSGIGCLAPTFSGNTLSFNAPEAYYGYFNIDLTFDKDVADDTSQISPASFVGGSFYYVTAHGGYGWNLNGPIVLTSVTSVPEPATWAMMLAGFGLIGGTMRRIRPAPIPAR